MTFIAEKLARERRNDIHSREISSGVGSVLLSHSKSEGDARWGFQGGMCATSATG